jgi:hypothetical protein
MKAIIKRLLKVVNNIITGLLWLLWGLIWTLMSIPVGIVAACIYIATGKDIIDWWFDKMGIIIDLSIKIDNKIDLL